ncbi:MAG TPA: UDP-N-acetylmuramoyl-L-alanine--D-glutamate ligase [Acidimicrobiales bacterium]|nr:UDP-N-acetylmuramoyl-L-alanine--D-glutamate ligase [Acidimicrobiales bacterium]
MSPPEPGAALVVGLGVAGEAAARQLGARGWAVTVVEDRPGPAARERAATLATLGIPTHDEPGPAALDALVAGSDLVVPSPPVPPNHAAVVGARRRHIPVWSEFELAARWSSLPLVAITGTNGKTTVTALVETMLAASGLRTVAAGNNDLPLVDALAREQELDVVVVEASSFRLCFTEQFRPRVGTWLNLAEDHLDWHPDMAHYRAAKARLWAAQGPGDVAVANAEDATVLAATTGLASEVVTFGLRRGDWRVHGGRLVMPGGDTLLDAGELWRNLPHDQANALAAAATARAAGASLDGVRRALRRFRGLPHRVSLVAEAAGVRFYDDSKATDPHAAATALAGFPSVVLIAGGRNKGLDLSVLATAADRVRAVVAIGEAAGEVVLAFAATPVPVHQAGSMDAAVATARAVARPGDAVLLSPACASFDWYSSYAERGNDFARAVVHSIGAPA